MDRAIVAAYRGDFLTDMRPLYQGMGRAQRCCCAAVFHKTPRSLPAGETAASERNALLLHPCARSPQIEAEPIDALPTRQFG